MNVEERAFWELRSSYLFAIEWLEHDQRKIEVALSVLRERLAEHEAKRGELFPACMALGENSTPPTRAGGIDRLNGGSYLLGNVVPCCAPCNYAKGGLPEYEFLALVAKVHRFQGEL